MRYLMVAIIALLVPAAAMAKGECKADRKKFCADVTEKADIKACLDQHMAELSAECKTNREAKAKKNNAEGSAKTPGPSEQPAAPSTGAPTPAPSPTAPPAPNNQ